MRTLKVKEYLDDNKVVVELDNKEYTRTVKINIADQDYIKVNNREFLV